jgi:hypothetical protein
MEVVVNDDKFCIAIFHLCFLKIYNALNIYII